MPTWINDEKLEERVLEAERPVAIAFLQYASPPSANFIPEYNIVAEEFHEKMEFYGINVEENPTIADDLNVNSVPTTLIYRDAEEIARYEGPYSRETLRERLTTLLGSKQS